MVRLWPRRAALAEQRRSPKARLEVAPALAEAEGEQLEDEAVAALVHCCGLVWFTGVFAVWVAVRIWAAYVVLAPEATDVLHGHGLGT